jgi:hypothetical protein
VSDCAKDLMSALVKAKERGNVVGFVGDATLRLNVGCCSTASLYFRRLVDKRCAIRCSSDLFGSGKANVPKGEEFYRVLIAAGGCTAAQLHSCTFCAC